MAQIQLTVLGGFRQAKAIYNLLDRDSNSTGPNGRGRRQGQGSLDRLGKPPPVV